MQIERLLEDVTESPPGTSARQQHIKVTEMLNERYPDTPITHKAVEKWAARGSIPSAWLMRVCALPAKPLNPHNYA